jgi:hypothetical protein
MIIMAISIGTIILAILIIGNLIKAQIMMENEIERLRKANQEYAEYNEELYIANTELAKELNKC